MAVSDSLCKIRRVSIAATVAKPLQSSFESLNFAGERCTPIGDGSFGADPKSY